MPIGVGRRQVIAALGGAPFAWPLATRAQQAAPGMWRIGVLAQKRRQDSLRQGLRDLGYLEGKNLVIDARSNDKSDQLDAFAKDLVGVNPNAIVAAGTEAVQAVQRATTTIPIVLFASDPVGSHLVASLANPGSNTTGVSVLSVELSAKRIELLKAVVGELSSIAVLWKPDDPPVAVAFQKIQGVARDMQLRMRGVEAREVNDLGAAFESIDAAKPQALVILSAPLMSTQVARIAELALNNHIPAIYSDRSFPEAGGLMSYGPNFDAIMKHAAVFVDKIFRGGKPATLPIEQPTLFELVINLKTAKALGLAVPTTLLATADEVIE
jgi:ABC-type uncharacterized transport system substrate-binding protein